MSIFSYDDQYRAQIAKMDDIVLCCQEVRDGYERKARMYADAYKNRLSALAEFILKELPPIYGNMGLNELIDALGTPTIDLDRSLVSYFEATLDGDHMIEVEFGGLFERFYRVSMDG